MVRENRTQHDVHLVFVFITFITITDPEQSHYLLSFTNILSQDPSPSRPIQDRESSKTKGSRQTLESQPMPQPNPTQFDVVSINLRVLTWETTSRLELKIPFNWNNASLLISTKSSLSFCRRKQFFSANSLLLLLYFTVKAAWLL